MSKKEKLTIEEQISYMRDHCGIVFTLCSEETAEKFLNESTYFFKVKAFAKNFQKDSVTQKYSNLDFAYLRELSTLDAHLRKEILAIALDVEHFLKVGLIREFSKAPKVEQDGYDIISRFFIVFPNVKAGIVEKAQNSYCRDLVEKMESEGYAIWNAIEVLSFGQFTLLYRLYSENNNDWNKKVCNLLFPVKSIRNAAAHNNCILNSLQHPYYSKITPSIQVETFVSTVPSLKKSKSRKTKLSNPVIHDFVALLYLFDKICTSNKTKYYTYERLYNFFHDRLTYHADYFKENACIISTYEFVVKIVDFLYQNSYNNIVEQKS